MAQKMSQVEKLMFTKHLGLMLRSGISLGEAVDTMVLQMKKESTRKIIEKIRARISNGETMEKALSGFPLVFDALYRSIVAVGERSGSLDKSLEYLASNIGKSYEFKKKVKSAMMYPTIVLAAAAISGTMVTLFVLPKLVLMFNSLDVELPISTKILMFVATVSKDFGWLIVLGVLGAVFLGVTLLRLPNIRRSWQRFWMKTPWLGDLMTEIQVALMCRNLGVMIKSAIPLDEAIQISAASTENLVFKRYLERWYKAVVAGKSLGEEMGQKGYRFVPVIVPRMVRVGEKSGNLDETLLYLADFFEEEVDDKVRNLGSIIEPVMLVVIAVVVGFVAMAIISPIYQLTGGVHR